ncbi:MAG: hypothetical protein KN64_02120 [Sulfurovum sp. AS07-7]|nr:MAG: hypothetical protein KN64_02120 [Sulfurovum sp. AS07-7]
MDKLIRNSTAEFLIFTTQNSEDSIEVKIFEESVWLTQTMIAQLFDVQRPAITKHLINIFESSELDEDSVSSILEHTANDGKTYKTKYYNLDAIISVGYRVNSKKATQFRQWATSVLKNYIQNGYTINSLKITNERFVSLENEVTLLKSQMQEMKTIIKIKKRFFILEQVSKI